MRNPRLELVNASQFIQPHVCERVGSRACFHNVSVQSGLEASMQARYYPSLAAQGAKLGCCESK